MSSYTKTKDMLYYVHCAIGILLMFFFRFLPAPEPITPFGMQMLGIFFGLIYMWSTVSTLWPSCLGLFALCFTEYGGVGAVTAASFGNPASVMLFLFLGIVVILEESGLATWIANKFLTIKALQGKPWLFTLCWFLLIATLASCCSMFLIIFTFWSVFYKIAEQVGFKKGDPYTSLMIIGILIFAAIGGIMIPFNGMAIIANSAYINMGRPGVEYAMYIPNVAAVLYSMVICYVGLMRFVFRCDVSPLKNYDFSQVAGEIQPMTKYQKVLGVFVIGAVILMILPGLVPKTTVFGYYLSKLQAQGILIGGFALLSMVKIDGKPMLDFNEVSGKISWNLFFIIATAMCISSAITADGTGVKDFLLAFLEPILTTLSPMAFVVLLCVISVILTNIFNNIVICLVMISILSVYATAYPVNEPVALTLLIVCACLGYMLPSSSVSGAILHGNPWLTPQIIYKYVFVILIMMTLCTICVGAPLGFLLY